MREFNYEDWVREKNNPSYLVYIITGETIWKNDFMLGIKNHLGIDYTMIHKDVGDIIKKLKYRPLDRKKHVILFEPIGGISNSDFNSIEEYIKNPSKHALFVISITNYGDKKKILNKFKYIEKSKTVKFFDLDFPRSSFVRAYINDLIDNFKIQFKSKSDKDFLIRRLLPSPSDIKNELLTLKELGVVVDKETVKIYIEDKSSYNYERLYEVLSKLDRVKVPYITYSDLLEDGKKDITIMYNYRKFLELLLQAKYLRMEGILIDDDIISEGEKVFNEIGYNINNEISIWNESKYRINKLMRMSREVSLKDILKCMNIIDKNLPPIANAKGGRIVGYVDEGVVYKTFLEVLNRLE